MDEVANLQRLPQDGFAQYLLRFFFYRKRRYDQAESCWLFALQQMQYFAVFHRVLGIFAFNKKDSDENTDGKKSKSFRFKAAAIKKLRAKFDMSQAEFAKLVGVSTLTVSCWELGKTSPRAGAKERLAQLRSMGKREIAKMNKQTPKAPEEPAAPEEK